MRWVFVIAGVVCSVIAIIVAIDLVDLRHQSDKLKELQQKIDNTDYFKPAQFSLQLAFAQPYYNSTTGNYGDDPNNPNNAENIIIKYCIDHADLVAEGQNVVQTLVHSGLVPIFYDGRNCSDVQALHKESQWNLLFSIIIITFLLLLTKNAYSFSPEEQSVIDKAQKSLDSNYNNNSQVATNESIIPSITLLIWTGVKDCDSIDTSKDPVSFMGLIGTVLAGALTNKTNEINTTQIMDTQMPNFESGLQCIGYNWGLAIANQYEMNMSMSNMTEKYK